MTDFSHTVLLKSHKKEYTTDNCYLETIKTKTPVFNNSQRSLEAQVVSTCPKYYWLSELRSTVFSRWNYINCFLLSSTFRHVLLPKEFVKLLPKKRLMTEKEWRSLGVTQSRGWIHYLIHEPGMFSFYFLEACFMKLTEMEYRVFKEFRSQFCFFIRKKKRKNNLNL